MIKTPATAGVFFGVADFPADIPLTVTSFALIVAFSSYLLSDLEILASFGILLCGSVLVAWIIDSLLAAVAPAKSATLVFSGKSTMQSVKEAVSNPVLSDVRSLVDMGTNPFSIFSKLSSVRSNMVERENYGKTQQALSTLMPGDSEEKVAQIVRPEDVSFTIDGMVMAYPRFSLDFYVNGGVVKVLQQPSFLRLSRLHAAIFYVPDLRWDQCTPHNWRQALPADWQPPPGDEEGTVRAFSDDKKDP